MSRIKKLGQSGFDHVILLALFVVVFGLAGVTYLYFSHALSYNQIHLYSAASPTCLDNWGYDASNGGYAKIYTCNGKSGGTLWSRNGNLIQSAAGDVCLDDWQRSTKAGTAVRLYKCNASDPAQIFTAYGANQLINKASGLCLDDSGGSSANGATVDLYTCKKTALSNQEWFFAGSTGGGGSSNPYTCYSTVSGNTCYYWVQAYQSGNGNFSATGASIKMTQPNPTVTNPAGASVLTHSVMEMFVSSTDSKQSIEIGWYKDPGDSSPILFATDWVNNNFIGYAENGGTGFVQVSPNFKIGSKVTVGTTGTYKIQFASNQWQIWYNGAEIGYFPESVWTSRGASFTSIGWVSPYGEAAFQNLNKAVTVQMGNGTLGSNSGSASFSAYTLYGSSTAAQLTNFGSPSGNATAYYNYGHTSATGYTLGGPGPR